ncbi:lytic murein transglycosylase [Tropicimonas sp. IMCC6043]|uniref:lytic murein transglycosylase n=1 Tax=Tropicimonas sp. IMCC6043 TaxID=2510645 RepID=UPI00101D318D|nr:lytic murein transglycosylase [Tropicimonas sp. IMCC6043]RYH11523.1 lytic murein transglycosylase [Tropicimonas sp. IMCC6043]
MILSRRTAFLGMSAALLSACNSSGSAVSRAAPTRVRAVPNPAFDAWVVAFKPRAAANGISQATIDRAFRNVGYLPDVIEKDRNQTEFNRTLEDYFAIAASDERIRMGKQALNRQAATLAAVEARYGVEPQVVTAVWGLESKYGTRRGDIPVISSLSTLSYDGRRGAFMEKQLMAALRILQRGDTTPENMLGSWAGAMGHTQFIPTSFEAFAVDFNGDGRRDIWSDDPTDALASTAAYLNRNGWRRGQPWGLEVRLPAGFAGPTGRGNRRSVAAWTAAGVTDMDGRALPDHGAGAILAPEGLGGPAFLVFGNFNVILTYNNAESYALGVGHLSDRILGKPPIRGTFAPDRNGMTLDDRKDLQRRLNAKGYDVGEPDGVIGSKTEEAISAYQTANGLAVTGQPSMALLARLR